MTIHKSSEQGTQQQGKKQGEGQQAQQQGHPIQKTQQQKGQQQGLQRRGEREPSGLGGYGWGNEFSPFTMMRRMFEDMDRLFEDFGLGFGSYGRGLMGESGGMSQWWSPQIDVVRRGDSLVITADLPGMRDEDVHVEVDNGVLTISGERKQEHEEESGGVFRSERRYGSFHREIGLPEGVNLDDAEATFKDGVLCVTLKLNEQKSQSRQISINKGESPKPVDIAAGAEKGAHASESSPEPVEGSPELKNIH